MVSVDDSTRLEAIGGSEPSLWSGSITGLTAYTYSVVRNSYKIKVEVGQLFECKIGGSDAQFAYITPVDVEATEYNAKIPPEDWVDFEDTLKLKFNSEEAVVDQAAATEEMAASSSNAEASSSVGWSCDDVVAAVEEAVNRTPLTNGKEPARPHLGRQMSMRAHRLAQTMSGLSIRSASHRMVSLGTWPWRLRCMSASTALCIPEISMSKP